MKLMEPDGTNKKIQQELILVWLTELNKGKIEKLQKKTAFQKMTIFQNGVKDKIKYKLYWFGST